MVDQQMVFLQEMWIASRCQDRQVFGRLPGAVKVLILLVWSTCGKKPQTMPLVTVCCPLCGGTVAGEDKTALGNHLNKHWTDDHRIRPTLGAEAGIGKGKGH